MSRRVTRHFVGSSAVAPIVLDSSSSSDIDDEPTFIGANNTNVEVKLTDNVNPKVTTNTKTKSKPKPKPKPKSKSKTKANTKTNNKTDTKFNSSITSQTSSKAHVLPKSAPVSSSSTTTSASHSHKRRKLREDNLDLDSVLQASKEINRVVRNQKSERKLASASMAALASSSASSSATSTSPSTPSQPIMAQDEKTTCVSLAAQPAQPAQNGGSRDGGIIVNTTTQVPREYHTSTNSSDMQSNLNTALNIPIKKRIVPAPKLVETKETKPNITKFDPRIHKPYKDIYDTFCITCEKKGRSDLCNRQKPCDICVGKKKGGCSYPPNAKIIIPASIKSRYSQGPVTDNNNNNNVILHKLRIPKRVSLRTPSNADIRKALRNADEKKTKANDVNKSSLPSPLPTPIPSSRNSSKILESKTEEFEESEDDQIEIGNNSDDSELEISSDYDEGNGDDDDEDAYDRRIERRRIRTALERKARNGSNINMDSFMQTQRILQELEFEKRDVNEIYTLGRRRRREATRENYKLPSEDDESDSNLDDGYAIAEARNEQIILSEDEEEKRFLRGELTMDYIREKERKQRKQIVSESSSEDDFEI
ncbi:hypothetical protein CANINC_002624 [Pichia inconspicua]|uniref:Uncharacterized protein n=1 Tax=Pichia inconspicua TaxID=52247 RepID=A0A4T0X137_9ASCO|nr:hypothetical protein CANINC_002624 [[Candida] inconspicua]